MKYISGVITAQKQSINIHITGSVSVSPYSWLSIRLDMKSLVQLVFTLLLSLTVGRKVHLHLSIQDDLDSAANGE